MELEDINDLPHEFKGGTLEINCEDLKYSPSRTKLSDDDNNANCSEINNKSRWNSFSMSQFISFPQRISENIWKKKSSNTTEVTSIEPVPSLISTEVASDFFTFREGIVDDAIKECVQQLLNGETWSAYLLTEISLWDADKERLVLVTPNSLVIVKYDFIAMRQLDYKRLSLECIDTVVIGNLVYPTASIVPRLSGLADGLSGIVQNCLFDMWFKKKANEDLSNCLSSRDRNRHGIRLMWNNGKPLNFGSKWNPLSNDAPFSTFTSHPLFYHKDPKNESGKKLYDVEEFIENVCSNITKLEYNSNENKSCIIHHKDIVLDSYIGIGSLIHNRNALGFFKVRGRFSF